ncbi:hypothetical protein A2U01_0100905, partial [Trifolium medium]|nr:hypothetical protein [Trifolium medium]
LARNNELKDHTVIILVVAAVLSLVIKGNRGQVHKGVDQINLIAVCKVVDRIIGH